MSFGVLKKRCLCKEAYRLQLPSIVNLDTYKTCNVD